MVGKLDSNAHNTGAAFEKEHESQMTDERYTPPQQPAQYQQPYDWRYATTQQPYQPGTGSGPGSNWDPYRAPTSGPGKPRKRSPALSR